MLSDGRRAPKLSLSVTLSIAVHVLVFVIVAIIFYLQPPGSGLPMPSANAPQIIQATILSTRALSPPPPAEKPAEKPTPVAAPKQVAPTPPPEQIAKTKPQTEDTTKSLSPVDSKPAELKAKQPPAKPRTVSKHKAERKSVAKTKPVPTKQKPQLTAQQLADQRQQALKALGEQSLTQAVAAQQAEIAAQQLAAAQDTYKSQISSAVAGVWINPFQGSTQMELMVAVSIDAQGNVVDTKITQSSGNEVFDRQALLAVQKAAPFSAPPLAQGETQFTFYLHFLNNDTVGAS